MQVGGSVHSISNSLRTPLMLAAQEGHTDIVQYLIKSGAVVDTKVSQGRDHRQGHSREMFGEKHKMDHVIL